MVFCNILLLLNKESQANKLYIASVFDQYFTPARLINIKYNFLDKEDAITSHWPVYRQLNSVNMPSFGPWL